MLLSKWGINISLLQVSINGSANKSCWMLSAKLFKLSFSSFNSPCTPLNPCIFLSYVLSFMTSEKSLSSMLTITTSIACECCLQCLILSSMHHRQLCSSERKSYDAPFTNVIVINALNMAFHIPISLHAEDKRLCRSGGVTQKLFPPIFDTDYIEGWNRYNRIQEIINLTIVVRINWLSLFYLQVRVILK